ncbi:hypothetical protein [Paracoccus shanxieyensis]|uniref:DUF3299 domain-containing protein n=1 Tax=Paracoccus shanxieyensis TaxID=2675752 RepID=A0A6L6IWH6_9RHOB|nr:hypothetical protein [Paracoccus shanxieyensis]MTH62717.1 hypothetical protein [Paracoccus shanxieyensis]MTH86199.1 hypothetical protein [Paracoccus shanxieyensis]
MKRRHFLASGLALPLLGVPALAAPTPLKFRDLYVRGRQLTPQAQALNGKQVQMIGYMAPPLKPEIDFFVLTKLPMSVCPFCENEAQWPDDIVLALTDAPVDPVRYTDLIRASGTFETGFDTDPKTGFVSFIRLRGTEYQKL